MYRSSHVCIFLFVVASSSSYNHHAYSRMSLDTQCTSIKGLMVSIRWYLGCLKGSLGGCSRSACRIEEHFVVLGCRLMGACLFNSRFSLELHCTMAGSCRPLASLIEPNTTPSHEPQLNSPELAWTLLWGVGCMSGGSIGLYESMTI